MGQLLVSMDHSLLKLATSGLILVLIGFSSGAPTDGDCLSILGQSQLLSATYPKRIAHGVHSLTLADLRHYFNPKANKTNNIPTINRNLSSSDPILNDAPDIRQSDRFQSMGLLVAEEVVLNEDRDWDLHNADTLESCCTHFTCTRCGPRLQGCTRISLPTLPPTPTSAPAWLMLRTMEFTLT